MYPESASFFDIMNAYQAKVYQEGFRGSSCKFDVIRRNSVTFGNNSDTSVKNHFSSDYRCDWLLFCR